MTITLHIGDGSRSFADKIKEIDPTATLLTLETFDLTNQSDVTLYTSVIDLPAINLRDVGLQAHRVIWHEFREDQAKEYLYRNTVAFLAYLSMQRTVENFASPDKVNKYKYLNSERKTEGRQIWAVGCSFTMGVGVEQNQRYATLISEELGLPLSVLACEGSSLTWAADQILRSDIREGDIVIWGLTSNNRVAIWHNTEIHLNSSTASAEVLHRLLEEDLRARNVKAIAQVENFCSKVGTNLYVAGLLDPLEHLVTCYQMKHYIDFVFNDGPGYFTGFGFIDYGTDDMHPGPLQHRYYADKILKEIKETI